MKKLLCILLVAVSALSVTSCDWIQENLLNKSNKTEQYRPTRKPKKQVGVERLFTVAATRPLTEVDLYGLDASELRILRNSIYARHGYIFKSDDLRLYFSKFDWYYPDSPNVESRLSQIERKNVSFIKAHEK